MTSIEQLSAIAIKEFEKMKRITGHSHEIPLYHGKSKNQVHHIHKEGCCMTFLNAHTAALFYLSFYNTVLARLTITETFASQYPERPTYY